MKTTSKNLRDLDSLTVLRAVLVGLLLTLTVAGSATAEDGRLTIGFGVGSAGLSSDSDLEERADFRFGYGFNDRFAIEGQVIRATAILNSELDAILVNGVINLRPGKAVEPYVLGGAGFARLEDIQLFGRSSSDSGPAFQVAIGTRVFFGEAKRVGARFELSSLWERTDVFDTDQHTSLTAGMTWKLGE